MMQSDRKNDITVTNDNTQLYQLQIHDKIPTSIRLYQKIFHVN